MDTIDDIETGCALTIQISFQFFVSCISILVMPGSMHRSKSRVASEGDATNRNLVGKKESVGNHFLIELTKRGFNFLPLLSQL